MVQIAEDFKVLNEDEIHEALETAKKAIEDQDAKWKAEQECFLDENPELREDEELNLAFVSEVNKLIVTDLGMKSTDRQILEAAYVNLHISYEPHDPKQLH